MKTVIYYFSGTGNSLKVAKDLAEKLGDTEIISIPKVMNSNITLSVDNIGIIFPVYCWGMPVMAAKFIKKLKKEHAKYFFSIATSGGDSPGNALLQTGKILAKNDIKLAFGFDVQLPTNYIVWGGAISEESQKKMFKKWDERINDIVNIIKKQEVHTVESGTFFTKYFLGKAAYSLAASNFRKMDKSFKTDEKCTQCGICEKICPAKNIEIKGGKPVWNHKCEQCLACIQWCPEEAIQYGEKTKDRKRYTNPFVSLKDLL